MRRRGGALLAGATLALAMAACGGDGSQEEGAASGVGPDTGPLPVNLADCRDWNDASVEQRLATIKQIREFTGGEVAGTGGARGSTLPDEKAYDLFENFCENEFARGFKLYKLYGRAAAFGGG